MATNLIGQWNDGREVFDGPTIWRKTSKIDQTTACNGNNKIHPLEVAHNSVQTNPEAAVELFGRGGPLHVEAEEMAEDRLHQMEGDASEEKKEHWCPFGGIPQREEKGPLSHTMSEHGVTQRAQKVENDGHSNKDLP